MSDDSATKAEDLSPIYLHVSDLKDDHRKGFRWNEARRSSILQGKVSIILVTAHNFHDQEWGGTPNCLALALFDANDAVLARCNIYGNYRSPGYSYGKLAFRSFSSTEPVVQLAQPGHYYRLEYFIGGSGCKLFVDSWTCKIFYRESGLSTFRMADPDGDQGFYIGPVCPNGLASGRGRLEYDDDCSFTGDFVNGSMIEGALYRREVPIGTMTKGSWTPGSNQQQPDESIVCRYSQQAVHIASKTKVKPAVEQREEWSVYHGGNIDWTTLSKANLKRLRIASTVEQIEDRTFKNCGALEEIDFTEANALKTIGYEAFDSCNSLESMTSLPPTLETIDKFAFYGCPSLKDIQVGEATSLRKIGDFAFQGCDALGDIDYSSASTLLTRGRTKGGIEQQGEWFIYHGGKVNWASGPVSKAEVQRLKIASTVEKIEDSTFMGCRSLSEIDFSEATSLIEISRGFEGCTSLKAIDLSKATKLKKIGVKSFYGCEGVTRVEPFPPSLETIETQTFRCNKMPEIDLSGATSLRTIGSQAFEYCGCLTTIGKIPPSLEVIGGHSFTHNRVKELDFSGAASLRVLSGAFKHCKDLEKIDFSGATSLQEIGGGSFIGCATLATVTKLPPNLQKIETSAFEGCAGLSNIDFTTSPSLRKIGEKAFRGCKLLKTAKFPPKLETVGEQAFDDCGALTQIDMSDAILKDTIVFGGCKALIAAKVPDTINAFSDGVFRDSKALVDIELKGDRNLALAVRLCVMYPYHTPTITNRRLVDMYSVGPIKEAELQLISQPDEQCEKLNEVKTNYVGYIVSRFQETGAAELSVPQQHGWVQFLANHVEEDTPESNALINFLTTARLETVKELAEAKDRDGRVALKFAMSHVRKVFEAKLLFLKRYALAVGAPIHKSVTCVVVKAEDANMEEYYTNEFLKYSKDDAYLDSFRFNLALQDMRLVSGDESSKKLAEDYFDRCNLDKDDKINEDEFVKFCLDRFGRNVILKFMRHEDQYHKELNGRDMLKGSNQFVVGIIRSHGASEVRENENSLVDHIKKFLPQEEEKMAKSYQHVLVMPFGDRNLDTIFRSERPDIPAVIMQMSEVGKALEYLHKNGLVHGDIKKLNVVRINGHLTLIDLDASARITTIDGEEGEYIGAKFSSGVLPPEMIYCFDGNDLNKILDETKMLERYFEYENKEGVTKEDWLKRKPKFGSRKAYAVRTFLQMGIKCDDFDQDTETVVETTKLVPKTEGLPFEPVLAEASVDVWAFGVLLYTMCTGRSLFRVNRDDDIIDGDELRKLYNWSNLDLETVLLDVADPYAKDLLKKLLHPIGAERPTMTEILNDPFFHLEKRFKESDGADERKKLDELRLRKMEAMIKDGFSQVQQSLSRVISYQTATNAMLKDVLQGGAIPKYFILSPLQKEEDGQKSFFKSISKLKKAVNVTVEARLCFICPITLQPVIDRSGEAMGYNVPVPAEWVKKYGPAILIGLKLVQAGLTIGRCFGLPLPSLSGAEKDLAEASDVFAEFQGIIVDELGGEEEDGLLDVLLSQFEGQLERGLGTQTMTEAHRSRIQEAYSDIGTLIDDEKFEKSGLLVAGHGHGTEWVHPDMVPVYEKYGNKCFEMPPDELERAKVMLAPQSVVDTTEVTNQGNDLNLQSPTEDQARAKHNARPKASVQTGTAIPEQTGIVHDLARADIRSLSETLSGDIESLRRRVQRLEGQPLQALAQDQGADRPRPQIVHDGPLEIQSHQYPCYWKERHVVVDTTGRVSYFKKGSDVNDPSIGGVSFPFVKWESVPGGANNRLELLSEKGDLIANVRLSQRGSSTVEDWLRHGNSWQKQDPKPTVGVIAPSSKRLDHAGVVN